jgi:hypothetical protein
MYKKVFAYFLKNKIVAFVGFYFLLSAALKATMDWDFCIPCLWKLIFHVKCPGCGLTTAFIEILKLDLRSAFEINWLIFIVLPYGIWYLMKDFLEFKKSVEKNGKLINSDLD